MTASISASTGGRPPALAGLLVLLMAMTLLASPGAWSGGEFRVINAEAHLVEGVYRVDANIEFELNGPVREALVNGVPLVFEIDLRIRRPREWLWDETVATLVQRYQLRYHALSNRYVVRHLNTAGQHSFASPGDALYHIGSVRGLPLIDQALLEPGVPYEAGIRARLDIESLPSPMQVVAYVSRNWWLDSDWYTWPLAP